MCVINSTGFFPLQKFHWAFLNFLTCDLCLLAVYMRRKHIIYSSLLKKLLSRCIYCVFAYNNGWFCVVFDSYIILKTQVIASMISAYIQNFALFILLLKLIIAYWLLIRNRFFITYVYILNVNKILFFTFTTEDYGCTLPSQYFATSTTTRQISIYCSDVTEIFVLRRDLLRIYELWKADAIIKTIYAEC